MVRGVAGAVGLVLLAATAHATIVAGGGYEGAHAYVTMAIAAGVGIGALAIGSAWSSRQRGLAAWLAIAIVAGEAFGFISTAERLVVSREAAQAPLRDAEAVRAKAERRLSDATAAMTKAPTSSPRLEAAIAEKGAADQAAAEKAAERGCRENCRQLLQARVDTAGAEIAAARAALAEIGTARKSELDAARLALAALRAPPSATPLADRLGLPPWALDLIAAALGSIAANGLACGLIAFSAHHNRIDRSAATMAHEAQATAIEINPPQPLLSAAKCVERFALDRLFSAGEDETVDLAAIEAGIRRWCTQRQIAPPSASALGRAIGDLFAQAGINVEQRGSKLVAVGLTLKPEQLALPAPSRLGPMHRKEFA